MLCIVDRLFALVGPICQYAYIHCTLPAAPRMPDILGNLGSHLLQSVTDKAGNIGNRFEEDFSGLAHNITGLARNITGALNVLCMFFLAKIDIFSIEKPFRT